MSAADRIGARAEALGVWIGSHDPQTRVYPDGVDWNIGRAVDGSYSVRAVGSAVYETLPGGRRSTTGDRHWRLDETTAEVWLLALASGATMTRTCPVCDGERVEQKKVHVETMWNVRLEWAAKGTADVSGMQLIERPCPVCSATGLVRVEAARLVCEAAAWRRVDGAGSWCIACADPSGEGPAEAGWQETREGVRNCLCDECFDHGFRTELLAVAYGLDPGASDEQRVATGYDCPDCYHGSGPPDDYSEPCAQHAPEPDEALVLRDYLADRGLAPADLTLDVLAEFGDPPATDFGRVLVAWLGGVACTLCSGQGSPVYQWFKCECSRCEATGLEVSALLAQVAS